ncbi:hypothetical protein TSAR_001853 [Trichomalopsis sarcophagae]|uniref:Uncharacterized protein n=1 Tax=Trichomalopsis sarcophagae TaxID=543379 RepID=A0A232F462_9HYME|nr:hypothetical protein TSAR_001853 [Trichomalopsis sarcophagae]
MKSVLVVFAAICIAGVLSDTKGDIDACVAESKVDTKLFEHMMHTPNFKATREMDCFAACMFKKDGVLDADGNVDASKLPNVDVSKVCGALRGKDACETAGKIMGCFAEKGVMDVFHIE